MVRCNSIEASTRSSMAEFDDSELFRSSECQENSDQVDLKFLSGENYRLVPTTSKLLEKFDSMDVKFTEIQKTLSQLCNQLGIRPIEAEPSRQKLPVTHSDPYTREASNRLTLDNRKSLLRKIEMPKFDGSNASDWLSKVDRFFRVGRYSDLDKLDLVALSLEGDVLKWFNWKMLCRKFHSWDDFRRRLLLKFGAASEESPRNRLFAIKQTGTVSAYVTQFEELSAQVLGLDELHLEELFYKGLKPAMREVLKLKEPVGLENQKKAVLRMETSSFCHLSSDKSTKAWGSQKPFTPKPVTTSTQPRPLLLPIGEGQGTGQIVAATPPVLPPRQRHTAEQQPVHNEESITHLQVPVPKLQEHSLQMHNESPNVCENSLAVVRCDGLGKEVNLLSGLSQTHQVWEPGGVLAEHVLVDWLVDFNDYEESLDGTATNEEDDDGVPVVTKGPVRLVRLVKQKRKFTKSWSFKYKSSLRNTRVTSREMKQFAGFMKFHLKHKWRSKHLHTISALNCYINSVFSTVTSATSGRLQGLLEQVLQRDDEAYPKILDKLQLNFKQGMDVHGASGLRLFLCQQQFSSIWHRWRRKD